MSGSRKTSWAAYVIAFAMVIVAIGLVSREVLDDRRGRAPATVNGPRSAPLPERTVSDEARDAVPASWPVADSEANDSETASIPIPPDLAELFERDANLARFHGLMAGEPRDTEWANSLEQRFRDYIAGRLSASEHIVQLVQCGTNSCELLATGYGPDVANEWLESMTDIFESGQVNEWALGTGEGRCSQEPLAPNVFGLYCIYSQNSAISAPTMPPGVLSIDEPFPEGSFVDRVDVPEPMAELIESDERIYELHRELETETRDADWADAQEAALARHFNDLPKLPALSVTQIECRTTLCEVHLVLTDPPMHSVLLEEVSAFHSAWPGLATDRMTGGDLEDSEMEVVWLLRRE